MWPEYEKTRYQDLIPAYHDLGQFYWHKENGREPVSNLGDDQDLRLERERLYRRAGGMQVINIDYLRGKQRIKQPKTGHVVLERHETIKINDQAIIKEANNLSSLDQGGKNKI